MNWLKYLVAFAALIVAGCAAYFSVTGLSILFSGSSFAVAIMASSLEIAKLITATYLKQRWKVIKGFNKWYLTSAVIILMLITSAGIFGYLSNAFQQQNIKLEQVQREISVWDVKITSNNQEIKTLSGQLTNLQTNQGKILDNKKINNRLLRSVDNRDKQVSKLSDKISVLQDENVKYNEKINDIKNININLEREVGGFRFVAEAFGVDLKNVVKFFILLIVVVFDPLAIALVIAFNSLITEEKEELILPQDVLGEITRLRLSDNDLDVLEKHLMNPPGPNEKLKEAAKRYDALKEVDVPNELWDKIRKKHQERIDNGETFEDEPTALANSGYTERDDYGDDYEFHAEELHPKTLADIHLENDEIKNLTEHLNQEIEIPPTQEKTEDDGSKKKI